MPSSTASHCFPEMHPGRPKSFTGSSPDPRAECGFWAGYHGWSVVLLLLIFGNVWSGIGQQHRVRMGRVLPFEMGGLRPGENEGMESFHRVPFLTFPRAPGAAALSWFLSCFQLRNPPCTVLFLCPLLSSSNPSASSADFLSAYRDQTRG